MARFWGPPPWSGGWVHRNASDTTFIYCPTDSLDWLGFPPGCMMGMMFPDSVWSQIIEMDPDSLSHGDSSFFAGYHADVFNPMGSYMMGMNRGFFKDIRLHLHYEDNELASRGLSEDNITLRYWGSDSQWHNLADAVVDTESNIVVIDQNNVRTYYALTASAATSVEEKSKEEHQIRKPHDLLSNHPNPFILKTVIRYRISAISEGTNDDQKARQVSLQIYDILGQKVRSLVNGSQKPGIYEVVWRGKDDIGKFLPNGIYFYRLQVDSFSKVRKMIFMR